MSPDPVGGRHNEKKLCQVSGKHTVGDIVFYKHLFLVFLFVLFIFFFFFFFFSVSFFLNFFSTFDFRNKVENMNMEVSFYISYNYALLYRSQLKM